jgi:formiminoglutamase
MASRVDMSLWTGRVDHVDGEAGRRWHQVVRAVEDADRSGLALIGFASDAGVRRNHGRVGAADGPGALRSSLANLAWHGSVDERLYDAGCIACDGDALEQAQSRYAERIASLLAAGHRPIGLGGGHEIAWGSWQGAERALRGDERLERLGIINFDAHLDLRQPEQSGRGTSGTPFLQIAQASAAAGREFRYLCIGASRAANTPALFERGRSLGAHVVHDTETVWPNLPALAQRIDDFIEGCSGVYLTFCLDVLPADTAPGVSAPAALGMAPDLAIALLRSVLETCRRGEDRSKLVLADLAELNPRYDIEARTARIAARIVHEIATGWCP